MISSSLDAAAEAASDTSYSKVEAHEAARRRTVRELANLRIVHTEDGSPSGVVVDLTRASAAERHALEELAMENLFRHVPGVALVDRAEDASCASRLGLTATLRVDGLASNADVELASELCRALAGAPADLFAMARGLEAYLRGQRR